MPALIEFYNAHKSDRFEILAFHDDSVKTLAELDDKLAEKKIPEKRWGGQPLPFPILLDATGKTLKQYGVHAFPTTIVVDPDGNLVGEMGLEGFQKLLQEHATDGGSHDPK